MLPASRGTHVSLLDRALARCRRPRCRGGPRRRRRIGCRRRLPDHGQDIKNRTIEARTWPRSGHDHQGQERATLKLKDLELEVTAKLGTQGPAGATGATGPPAPRAGGRPAGPAGADAARRRRCSPTGGTTLTAPARRRHRSARMGIGTSGSARPPTTRRLRQPGRLRRQDARRVSTVASRVHHRREPRKYADNAASVAFEVNPAARTARATARSSTPARPPATRGPRSTTADAGWYLTTRAGTATAAPRSPTCTLAQVKAACPTPRSDRAVRQGSRLRLLRCGRRLQINSTTYDFEPFGVIEKTS